MLDIGRLLILYGSQTFTAQERAERIWRMSKILHFTGPVLPMDEYPISRLLHEEFVLFIASTTGQGDEPDNMKKFWKFLLRKTLPSNSLSKLKFGVLGLGDSSYQKFNFVSKKLNKRLIQLGATPLLDVGLCDYQHDLGHDAVMIPWTKEYFLKLKTFFPTIEIDSIKSVFVPRWEITLLKEDVNKENSQCNGQLRDIYFSNEICDKLDAIELRLHKNIRTTDNSHFQDVRLLTFQTSNQKIDYSPGDIFNIRPRNAKEDIEDLFNIFQEHNIDIQSHHRLVAEKYHEDMPVPAFLKAPLTMYEIAEQYWDLRAYPTQYVFSLLALVSEDKLEKDKCLELSSPEGQEDWLNYCRRPKRTILEVLHDFHKSTSKLTIEVLFELFSPIKPRSFSIASSCLPSKGTQLDLLVAVVEYYTNLKVPRLGLCSNWLKRLRCGDRVYGWIKKGSFVFPEDVNIPHILIGPGTGLAPFRSLLEERSYQNKATKHNMHLFFGCRYKEKDYHCRAELEEMVNAEKLSIYCAFSRDREHKIYVQHKISEHSSVLWHLIKDKKAHIFISGNAKNMPDNVRDALIDVFCTSGNLELARAKDFMKSMEETYMMQTETWS